MSDLMTPKERVRLQKDVKELLSVPCEVLRSTEVRDADGGVHQSFSSIATYECTIAPTRQPMKEKVGGRIVAHGESVVTLEANADVTAEDRLLINNVTHVVLGVAMRANEMTKSVIAVRIDY